MSENELGAEAAVTVTRPTNKDLARFLKQSMDIIAEERFGEFGYDTCTEEEKLEILKEIFERGWIE